MPDGTCFEGIQSFLGSTFFGVFPWGLLVGSLRGVCKIEKNTKGKGLLLSFPSSFRKICLQTILREGGCMYNITDLLDLFDEHL